MSAACRPKRKEHGLSPTYATSEFVTTHEAEAQSTGAKRRQTQNTIGKSGDTLQYYQGSLSITTTAITSTRNISRAKRDRVIDLRNTMIIITEKKDATEDTRLRSVVGIGLFLIGVLSLCECDGINGKR